MRVIVTHKQPVRCAAYAPDGRTIATGSMDKTLHLVDAVTSEVLVEVGGFFHPILSVAYSPDGRRLAAATYDSEAMLEGGYTPLSVWDITSGGLTKPPRAVRRICREIRTVSCLAFSPDGRILAVGTGYHQDVLQVWDLPSKKVQTVRNLPGIWSLAFRPDGKLLAVGTSVGEIRLYQPTPWQRQGEVVGRLGARALAFSPDGRLLAAATGWKVTVWDVAARQATATLSGHRSNVTEVSFHPDGRTLASASHDGTVRLWDVGSGNERAALDFGIGKVQAVAFAPDGLTAIAGGDGGLVIWDVVD